MRILSFLIFFTFSFSTFSLAQKTTTVGNESTIKGTFHGLTIPLRDYVPDPNIVHPVVKQEKLGITTKDWPLHPSVNPNAMPNGIDPALQLKYERSKKSDSRSVGLNFDGIGYTNVNPADPSMDVGPNHVVQMINGSSGAYFRIWDKTGLALINQTYFDTFTGLPGGSGDPIVIYDQLAERWLISEFANSGNFLHVAISQTSDPLGAYYTYSYQTPSFPDYPKYSIWNDGYYVTTNENVSKIYALDRDEMLAGNAGVMQEFSLANFPTIGFQAATPVSLDGDVLPPANSPALFMRMADDAWSTAISADRLEIFSLDVDFDTPANSTLSGSFNLTTDPFDTELCGYTSFSCIEQPGTNTSLDPLREVLMNKIIYRNFGSYEVLVCNHVTDVDNTDHAGIRWYELRKNPGQNWEIYQQGTYSPDAESRWMAGIGINAAGDIGLAYNVSSNDTFPSIRYTGRRACDNLGVMTEPETVLAAGTASNGSNRYGDYGALTIDPITDEFWYTGMYNTASQWKTRVSAFSLESCAPIVSFESVNSLVKEDDANVDNGCLDYIDKEITVSIAQAPSAPVDINLLATGTASEGATADYIFFPAQVTLDVNTLTSNFTIRVFNDHESESQETIDLSYTISANGGDGVIGLTNQDHTLTITDDDLKPEDFTFGITIDFQDFETGLADFTTINPSDDTPFQVSNAAGASSGAWAVPATNTTQMAYVNDDDCDCDMNEVSLISPVYNFIGLTNANLNFDTYFEDNTYSGDNENAYVDVAINGGAFVQLFEIPGIENSWGNYDVDLSSYIGNTQVQVRFRYSDVTGWLYGLAIDNFLLTTNAPLEIEENISTATPDEASLGPNQTVYLYNPDNGKLLMKLENTSAHNFGCIDVSVDREGTVSYTTLSSIGDITDKNFLVTPEFQSTTATYNVTLYYSEESIDPWLNQSNNGCDGLDDLRVIGSSGSIALETASYQIGSPANQLTYNGVDYEFTSAMTGDLGGFAIADLKTKAQLFVNQTSGADTNNGSDWNNSYATLQAALDAINSNPCPSGTEIRIAKGTYYPTKDINGLATNTEDFTFYLDQNVTLIGGFIGSETAAENDDITLRDLVANETILSGDINIDDTPGYVNYSDNSDHVIYIDGIDSDAKIDGITVIGGNGMEGSGIYAFKSCTLKSVNIRACQSINVGSALFANGAGIVISIENLITENNNPDDVNAVNGATLTFTGNSEVKD